MVRAIRLINHTLFSLTNEHFTNLNVFILVEF